MTLLITVFAAVIVTVKWYQKDEDSLKIGALCFMYWGASLMWLVDAIFEYVELGQAYFQPAPMDMLNDGFLGLAGVAVGLVIWTVMLLIRDPRGRVKAHLEKKSENSSDSEKVEA